MFNKHGIEADVKSHASGPVVSRGLRPGSSTSRTSASSPFHDLARGLEVTVVAKSSYGLGSILVRKDSGVN